MSGLGKCPIVLLIGFIATYKGKLAGVIVMATPNAFSHLLGKEHQDKEKLISRGACISWSPKNLASSLLMFSIRWMVGNTPYRYFSAYSDPEARELGTIYQACNFIYLGQDSGAKFKYHDPNNPNRGWFSDRNFRKISYYKKYALKLGIQWQSLWNDGDKIYWEKISKVTATQLRQASKDHQARCQRLKIPRKHKYVYIRGKTRGETLKLLKLFFKNNSGKKDLAYPKTRGPNIEIKGPANLTSQSKIEITNEEVKENLCGQSNNNGILPQKLTKRPTPCSPSNKRRKTVSKITMPQVQQTNKKFYSIKEVSQMYKIGQ